MKSATIDDCLFYALSLVGIPYRWYREGEHITGTDKFWASNEPAPSAVQIRDNDLSIVCAGLINLMRRYVGLPVPGVDGSMGEDGVKWPGTTSAWFKYLKMQGKLEPIYTVKKYPRGTLLLRPFADNT